VYFKNTSIKKLLRIMISILEDSAMQKKQGLKKSRLILIKNNFIIDLKISFQKRQG